MASMRADDLARFSDRVRDSATVLDNGEVLWPFDIVVEAINELAASGRVVLGLDAREANDEGLVTEVPISSYEPTGSPNDVEGRSPAGGQGSGARRGHHRMAATPAPRHLVGRSSARSSNGFCQPAGAGWLR